MALKDTIRKYEWVLIPLLIVGSFFIGSHHGQRKIENSLESKTDTVTKVFPVYKDFPDPVSSASVGFIAIPKYAFVTDSIPYAVHDTTMKYVYVLREQKYYEEDEGRLRIWVSGYEPRLDRYELDKAETVINNTVYVNPPKWQFSFDGGIGADIFKNTFALYPFIGSRVEYDSKFKLGAEFGYAAFFGESALPAGPIIKVDFRYAFLRF